jgi:hypothetical protein
MATYCSQLDTCKENLHSTNVETKNVCPIAYNVIGLGEEAETDAKLKY